MEQVWNGYGTDTQLKIAFQVLHLMVWKGGVWNGIRGLDPELWIGVWIGTCARACSAPFMLSSSVSSVHHSVILFRPLQARSLECFLCEES